MDPSVGRYGEGRGRLWEALTFEHMLTGPVIHIVYWAGLGVIIIAAFSVVGASLGVALREQDWASMLLAVVMLVVGLLVVAVFGLLWRAFCEFYVIVFKIGDDLSALRKATDADQASPLRTSGGQRLS